MQKKVLGIDLGGTSVKLAILSKEGDVLQKWSIPTDNSDGGVKIVPGIIESIKYVIPPLKKRIELIVQSIKKLFSNN